MRRLLGLPLVLVIVLLASVGHRVSGVVRRTHLAGTLEAGVGLKAQPGELRVRVLRGWDFDRQHTTLWNSYYDVDVKVKLKFQSQSFETDSVDLVEEQSDRADQAKTEKEWKKEETFVVPLTNPNGAGELQCKSGVSVMAYDHHSIWGDAMIGWFAVSVDGMEPRKPAVRCKELRSLKAKRLTGHVCIQVEWRPKTQAAQPTRVDEANSRDDSTDADAGGHFALPESVATSTAIGGGINFPLALVGGPPGLSLSLSLDASLFEIEASTFRMVSGGVKIGLKLKIGVTLFVDGDVTLKSSDYAAKEGVGKMIADAALCLINHDKEKLLGGCKKLYDDVKGELHKVVTNAKADVAAAKAKGLEEYRKITSKIHTVEREGVQEAHEVVQDAHNELMHWFHVYHGAVADAVGREAEKLFPVLKTETQELDHVGVVKKYAQPYRTQAKSLWQKFEATLEGELEESVQALHAYQDQLKRWERDIFDDDDGDHPLDEAVVQHLYDKSRAQAIKETEEATNAKTDSQGKTIEMEAMIGLGASFSYKLTKVSLSASAEVKAGMWAKLFPGTPLQNKYELALAASLSLSAQTGPLSGAISASYLHHESETKIIVSGTLETSTKAKVALKALHGLASAARVIQEHLKRPDSKKGASALFGDLPAAVKAALEIPAVRNKFLEGLSSSARDVLSDIKSAYWAGIQFYFLYTKDNTDQGSEWHVTTKFRGTSRVKMDFGDAIGKLLPGAGAAVKDVLDFSWTHGYTIDLVTYQNGKKIDNKGSIPEQELGRLANAHAHH